MRKAYVHEALLDFPADGDPGAVGASVTVALCGHWQHEPPCPLAPHYTAARHEGPYLRIRVLFAVDPDREREVRERTAKALTAGTAPTLDGGTVTWRLIGHGPAPVAADDAGHAARLVSG